MYLSKLILNPRSRQVRRELADPYQLHCSVMSAFPEDLPSDERVLFRLDTAPLTGVLTLLVQSQHVPDWSALADAGKAYLLPARQIAAGQTLAFRLRANPTVKRTIEKNGENPGSPCSMPLSSSSCCGSGGQKKPDMSFARFFKSVQDAPWYSHFLAPAADELRTLPAGSSVLEVGTGAGKFIEIVQASYPLQCVGTDTAAAMLAQARQRTALKDVALQRVLPGAPFPFARGTFDAVCFCSVLFLLDEPLPLVEEAMRVLRLGGRIVTLPASAMRQPAGLTTIG